MMLLGFAGLGASMRRRKKIRLREVASTTLLRVIWRPASKGASKH